MSGNFEVCQIGTQARLAQAEAERDALAEIERLNGMLSATNWHRAQEEHNALRAERDALRADAERYRWLRKYLSTKDMPILCGRGVRDEPDERDAIDAAIDAATKGGSNG